MATVSPERLAERIARAALARANPGVIQPPLSEIIKPPPGNLSGDPDVQTSYQKYMQFGNQADVDTSELRRKLADAMLLSAKSRKQTLVNNNQRQSDRGMLNSGVSLNRNTETDTLFDTTDRDLNSTTEYNLGEIARKKLGFLQDYKNSIVVGNTKQTKAKADADAAALEAQRQADLVKRQQAELLAALNPIPSAPIPTSLPTSLYRPSAKPAPATIKKTVANASKKDQPKQTMKKGPQ